MKTLVIHPTDPSTDFLKKIYLDIGCEVIKTTIPKSVLKKKIKEADRIIMLGHGTEKGLFNSDYNVIIDSNLVYLLREKICVGIWCNADVFFKKYNLKGIYTGMIISEVEEAVLFNVDYTYSDIEYSNKVFAFLIRDLISKELNLESVKKMYVNLSNTDVARFNADKIFEN